jgi:hypothetical protein
MIDLGMRMTREGKMLETSIQICHKDERTVRNAALGALTDSDKICPLLVDAARAMG